MRDLREIKTWHCFFEQSGTFKKQFRKLGLGAFDYDILDDYGETDCKRDIFDEISKAFEGGESIFDNIIPDEEAIFAFFPCTRFEWQITMNYRGEQHGQCEWSDIRKGENHIQMMQELLDMDMNITKMVIICLRKNIPLVIENPYHTGHFLTRYWCYKPKVIDMDRRMNGDYYEKPTQYWFFNCDPLQNVIMDEAIAVYPTKYVAKERGAMRSAISPDYARRFIRTYLKEYNEMDVEE